MNNDKMVSVPFKALRDFLEHSACTYKGPEWTKNKAALRHAMSQPPLQDIPCAAKYSDLKKAAEACGPLPWRLIELGVTRSGLRDDHGFIAFMDYGHPAKYGACPDREAKAKFIGHATPAAVLSLIGRLEVSESMEGLYTSTVTVERAELDQTKRERDKLSESVEQQKALIASLRNDLQEAIAIDCDDDAKDACAEVERTGTPGAVIREMNDELADLRAKLAERDALLGRSRSFVAFVHKCCRKNKEYAPLHWQEMVELDRDLSVVAEPSVEACEQCRGEGRVGGPAPDQGGGKSCSSCDGTGSAIAEPSCLTCSDHGAVGNILNAEPCPDCTQITKMEV
jgi:hypothetical protein